MENIETQQTSQTGQTRRLTTILVADICGYSAMSEKDEASAIKLADLLYKIFGQQAAQHGGRVFNRAADGFLAEFPSANACMQAAIDFCQEVSARNNLSPNAISAKVRVGVHVGDVVDRDDGDILGHGVNIAARLQSAADPGMILASSNIINLLGPKFKSNAQKRGGLNLKNISENITAYQIDPEKSDLRPGWRLPRFLKSRGLIYGILISGVFVSLVALQDSRQEKIIHHKIETIIQDSLGGSADKTDSDISTAYIRDVLSSLQQSNIPSHQASFALLEAGDIDQAIRRLENSLNGIKFDSDEYVNTLHQIAALSYHHDSAKAVGHYETILEMRPNDEAAMFQLVKSYIIRLETEKAYTLSEQIVERGIGSPYQKARLQIDMAFNRVLNLDFDNAIRIFEKVESDVISTKNQRLKNEWQILFGYALARNGDLDQGESLIISSVRELEELGTDTNLPRAYSALGTINKMRAESSPNEKEQYLEKALTYYQKQYERGLEIDKKRDLVEALYSMGEIYLDLGHIRDAKQKFLESLKTARSNNYTNSEVRSRIGLAKIANLQNDMASVCQHVDFIIDIHRNRSVVPMNNNMLNTLEKFDCGFKRADL